ncbi:hypothetical protein Lsan_4111 [Legionella santicrucis]|uniref:Uncharacterized protein n=1 Tax=Legionella santicrucis TaxID=45074 RepID=A0A0W0Y9X7_9GAMM|nr:hypothetical protein [Legionella santicrucis]KTD53701.1 hypothetical protein Lsan_4111 [Legionella santicrucis]
MLSIQNIRIYAKDGQLTVSVKVNSLTNLSENLRLLSVTLRDDNWKSLAPKEPILEFPIDPAASRFYFERTFGILSLLHTNMFLDSKIWKEIEPKIRTTNYKEIANLNTEVNFYTAPVMLETDKQDETSKQQKSQDCLEVNLDDQMCLKTNVKITGATAGTIKINISPGSNSFFFKGLQGEGIKITESIGEIDFRNLNFQ